MRKRQKKKNKKNLIDISLGSWCGPYEPYPIISYQDIAASDFDTGIYRIGQKSDFTITSFHVEKVQ
jgi:hypothetical protein